VGPNLSLHVRVRVLAPVVVLLVHPQTCNQELLASSPGRDTGRPKWDTSYSSSVPAGTSLPFRSFQNLQSLMTLTRAGQRVVK
jgi:hypothetical protein